jgi:Uri superfamily endonuclease
VTEMKGTYILLIKLDRSCIIKIGKLGQIRFNKGFYAYVGSALNNLEKRVNRHLRSDKKNRWHIDYLLKHGKIQTIHYKESIKKEECSIATRLSDNFNYVNKFGSSDCNCNSHLFYSGRISVLRNLIIDIGLKKNTENVGNLFLGGLEHF